MFAGVVRRGIRVLGIEIYFFNNFHFLHPGLILVPSNRGDISPAYTWRLRMNLKTFSTNTQPQQLLICTCCAVVGLIIGLLSFAIAALSYVHIEFSSIAHFIKSLSGFVVHASIHVPVWAFCSLPIGLLATRLCMKYKIVRK